jgi:branched-chain amino acid transport system permease protein
MKKNNLILYGVLLVLGLTAPFLFPAFKVQISFMLILIILAMTWDVQGGQMGYNSFGNILFFGIGCIYAPAYKLECFFHLRSGLKVAEKKPFYTHQPNIFKALLWD